MAKKSKWVRSKVIYKTKASVDRKIKGYITKYGYTYQKRKVKGGYRLYVLRSDLEELPF